jgi:hypothetical protein
MRLADIFVESDGDLTTLSMLLLLGACVVLSVIATAACCGYWRHERQQERKLAELASEVERETRIVCEMRHHLTGADADSRPRLKVVKGR